MALSSANVGRTCTVPLMICPAVRPVSTISGPAASAADGSVRVAIRTAVPMKPAHFVAVIALTRRSRHQHTILERSAGTRSGATGCPPPSGLVDWSPTRHGGDMRRWLAVAAAGLLVASGCGSPPADHVRITVAAPDALFDAPLGV